MKLAKFSTAAALVAVAVLGACEGGGSQAPETPTGPQREQGPLQIEAGFGEIGVNPPEGVTDSWIANFAVPICLRGDSSSESVILTKVSYVRGPGDAKIESTIRTVKKSELRENSAGFASSTGPLEQALKPFGGELAAVEGAELSLACNALGTDGYAELITSVEVGGQGAAINGLELTYTFQGRTYTAVSEFGYLACGDSRNPELCA